MLEENIMDSLNARLTKTLNESGINPQKQRPLQVCKVERFLPSGMRQVIMELITRRGMMKQKFSSKKMVIAQINEKLMKLKLFNRKTPKINLFDIIDESILEHIIRMHFRNMLKKNLTKKFLL